MYLGDSMKIRANSIAFIMGLAFCLGVFSNTSSHATQPSGNGGANHWVTPMKKEKTSLIPPYQVMLLTDKHTYKIPDSITVTAFLINKSHLPLYVEKFMEWGYSNSFYLIIQNDLTGKYIPDIFGDAPVPPPGSRHDFLELWPNNVYGRSFKSSLKDLNITKAGKYKLTVQYHCPVPQSMSFGLPIWSREMGFITSNTVIISVTN